MLYATRALTCRHRNVTVDPRPYQPHRRREVVTVWEVFLPADLAPAIFGGGAWVRCGSLDGCRELAMEYGANLQLERREVRR